MNFPNPSAANFPLEKAIGAVLKFAFPPLWLFAYWPTGAWLMEKAAQFSDVLVQKLLLGVALVLLLARTRVDAQLYARRPAIGLLLGASFGGWLNARSIALPQAQASCFLLGAYAWLGFNRQARYWDRGVHYALLLALLVPFYLEFSSGLGFGLRLLTAAWVGNSLGAFGFTALSAHDVIVAENAIAHVDLPCSGLKSLWTGSGFFLAACALLGVRLGVRVLVKYLLFLLLLLSANALRILVLTLLASALHMPDVAEVLHRPLGLLGFGGSCAVAWWSLARSAKTVVQCHMTPATWQVASACLTLVLGVAAVQGMAAQPPNALAPDGAFNALGLPKELQPTALPLTAAETRYFARTPQTIARKWRMAAGRYTGSVLLVQSHDFNGFHAPELCLAASGVAVDWMRSATLAPGLNVRLLSLGRGKANGVYWLQSATATTDDFLRRYWRYLYAERDWRLVFIILDAPDRPAMEKLAHSIYAHQLGEQHAMAIVE